MDELDKDGILDGLTGELDDYSAEKMNLPGKDITITISAGKGDGDSEAEEKPGMCSGGCSMHCGGEVH